MRKSWAAMTVGMVAASLAIGASSASATTLNTPTISGSMSLVSSAAGSKGKALPGAEVSNAPKEVASLAKYVTFSASGYTLNAPGDVLKNIDAGTVSAVRQNMATTNELIAKGQVVMGTDGVARPVVQASSASSPSGLSVSKAAVDNNYWESHWYGYKIHFNKATWTKVQYGVGGAGGASTVIAYLKGIPSPIAGAIALGIGIAKFCENDRGGITFYVVTAPLAVVCNPF